jgi:hypothetical protein
MRTPIHTTACLLALLLTLSILLTGCASTASPTPPAPRLRIINSGTQDIKNLTVWFPEDEIEFGDIPAGATTPYKHVPHGVYHYAAYRLDINGENVTQPVIDWVGEEPMPGESFTYTLDFDANRPQLQPIQLTNVTQDE